MPVLEAAYAPTYSLPRAKESLTELNQKPELIIPDRLRELVEPDRIVATPYTISIGSWFSDNAYDVDLAVLISQVLDTPYAGFADDRYFSWSQIQNDPAIKKIHWRQILEKHRKRVMTAGKIDEFHKPLVSVVAHSRDQMGVELKTLVVNHELQGQGIGSSFYRNWEDLLRERGYQYITGSHSVSTRPEFFFSLPGMRRTSDIDPRIAGRLRLDRDEYQSIKFLNDRFERLLLG